VTGRILVSPVVHPETGEIIADAGEELSDRIELEDGRVRDLVGEVIAAGVQKVHVRTVMACEAVHGVCAKCYGRNLASGKLVELGEAVGIIAAQSIGEPGTQLTMRTFHTGGVARADITTGLPRVEELFEARAPKGKALIADKEGVVSLEQTDEGRKLIITTHEQDSWSWKPEPEWELAVVDGTAVIKDKTVIAEKADGEKLYAPIDGTLFVEDGTVNIRNDRTEREEHVVPITYQVYVEEGDVVTPGQVLTDGALDPHDILLTLGRDHVQRYIIDEVQKVYRSQGVNTNDKHIEVICRQMLRKVSIVYPGDTDFLQDERIDRFEFNQINEEILAQGGEPATAMPTLLGITKAALETDSFLSAASFQETTRVLTEAAIQGKIDYLRGLKENVIIGKLIPAGSGFHARQRAKATVTALDEANLSAMTPEETAAHVARLEAEQASEAEVRELMDAGLIPEDGSATSNNEGDGAAVEWTGEDEE